MTAVMLKQILGTGLSWYTSTDAKAMDEIDIMVESAVLCFRQSFRCQQLCNMIFYLNFDFEVILHRCRRLKDRRNHGPADSAMISSPSYTAEYTLTDRQRILSCRNNSQNEHILY